MKFFNLAGASVIALSCAFAVMAPATAATAATTAAASTPVPGAGGLYVNYIDRSIEPGDDFFAYANNGWVKQVKIAADRTAAGVILEMDMQNEQRLKALVLGLTQQKNLSDEGKKLRDLYADYTDTAAINAAGMKPLETEFGVIASAKTHADILKRVAIPALQLDAPVAFSISVDDKHPDSYAVKLEQSGLGLPGRDYYLKPGKEMEATRAAYKRYLATMLGFAGVKNGAARAEAIFAFEKQIAAASLPPAARRDPNRMYNPMTVAELAAYAPGIDWSAYLKAAGISLSKNGKPREVIVAEKSVFPKLAKIFADTPVSVLQDYLRVQLVRSYAALLPEKVDAANFAFYGKVINGQGAQQPRALRGIHYLDENMGMALGKLYVAKYFSPKAKAEAKSLVENLLSAYSRDISTLSWMSPETRKKALTKLSQFTPKIGYPDKWRDYSALKITRGHLVENQMRIDAFVWDRQLKRLDKPVDKGEWGMTPQTNNAYYEPTLNQIVFPAAILQPPYFDLHSDAAVNYGEIGAAIGHEISHGFDDQGAKYDGHGVLRNWWTKADMQAFDKRISALGKEYDAEEPLPGLHINGKLTMGENIADLAGLEIAYKAYHLSLKGKDAPVIDGLTGDQRFFLAYAQSWRMIRREGALRKGLISNPHSPPKYRVNVVVKNVDAWYRAFNVKPGDKYYIAPEKRVHLW